MCVCVCVCGLNQLAVPCANVDSGCIAMAHRHAVVQAFQFDPESDPMEKHRMKKLQQQDVSEWLV